MGVDETWQDQAPGVIFDGVAVRHRLAGRAGADDAARIEQQPVVRPVARSATRPGVRVFKAVIQDSG